MADKYICEYDLNGFKKYVETFSPPQRTVRISMIEPPRSYPAPPTERNIDGHTYVLKYAPPLVNYRVAVFHIVRERRRDMQNIEVYYEFEKWE